jgi:NAD(P)H dehydrogenase (quinone)
MFAVLGITGQVGGAVARSLLAAGLPVRAIVRTTHKGEIWAEQGCEICVADIGDSDALTAAFEGASGVFVMLPPNFDPTEGFPETIHIVESIHRALDVTRPDRVVCLSTIGAQATQPNLLTKLGMMERRLGTLPIPVTFLRAAWFMENTARDIPALIADGAMPSYLQPLDKPVPMVATDDIGRIAAELLCQPDAASVVELEGPQRVTPLEMASVLGRLLGRTVRVEAVPRDSWFDAFREQGASNPEPRMRMLDGFNEGWIEFEHGVAGSIKGIVSIEQALTRLIERIAPQALRIAHDSRSSGQATPVLQVPLQESAE